MLRLNDIIEKVNLYLPDADVEVIKKAYVYSAKVHTGQKRISGEPYLSHPLEVAGILADIKLDEIEALCGKEVAFLVDGVTKISKLPFTSKIEEQAENFRKLILATAKDIRVVLVKLADRLHNMR